MYIPKKWKSAGIVSFKTGLLSVESNRVMLCHHQHNVWSSMVNKFLKYNYNIYNKVIFHSYKTATSICLQPLGQDMFDIVVFLDFL